jgi:cupin fold WbuC family metalloprotein
MKVFDEKYVELLIADAARSQRKRQHRNIHESYQDPCQRLFNAIQPGSYIRPHRHLATSSDELLIAVHGLMALVTFDDNGEIDTVLRIGSEQYRQDAAVGVEVPSATWHTVVALEPGSILLEVKAGPFDPEQPKEPAPWAPEEGAAAADRFLAGLFRHIASAT